MKVKHDFITNSSSTSFVMWGIRFDDDELKALLKKKFESYKKEYNWIDSQEDEFEAFTEFISGYFRKYNLSSHRKDYEVLIGKEVREIKDDETLLNFKLGILNSFKESGIETELDELQYIEECWEDR